MFVIGTRAQLIKMAPVVVEVQSRQENVLVVLTGQHQETMSDLMVEFKITAPVVNAVHVSERATVVSLVRWLPRALAGLIKQLRRSSSASNGIDVVVHGDTLSTLLGALAGRWVRGRVIHLESGLTSGKLLDPFPEELIRRLVFRLTDHAFCPTPEAERYMRLHHDAEVTCTLGNTIEDALRLVLPDANPVPMASTTVVVSIHRFQNIYDRQRLAHIVDLVVRLSADHAIFFILHPATRKRLVSLGLASALDREGITLSPRLGYADFMRLAVGSRCVITDGGSNQEELAVLGVPTIIMRARSERLDGLGENAVLEAEACGGEIVEFVSGGSVDQLRRLPRNDALVSPSIIIVDSLQR